MLRIIKDGLTIEADTQAELRLAMATLRGEDYPPLPAAKVGFALPPIGVGELGETVEGYTHRNTQSVSETRGFGGHTVQVSPSNGTIGKSTLASVAPIDIQTILVRRKLMDVLTVILTFPEGITCHGIATLEGLSDQVVSHRLTRLKKMGLVEKVSHSITWRASDLARKSKLVAS